MTSVSSSAEDRLYQDPDLARFYDSENGWAADLDYCSRLAVGAESVLDLGCGTGLLAAHLAAGGKRSVVAVDPARAMLEIARRRDAAGRVTWIEGDARSLRIDRTFDLVLLTGHAFQVFLSEDDQRAALATIAKHLAPDGRFIFDTRNPAFEEWREWSPEASERFFRHPGLGKVRAYNDVEYDAVAAIASYRTDYEIEESGESFSASSAIRFTGKEKLGALLDDAGLFVKEWLGDWAGGPWSPNAKEIIPIGRLLPADFAAER